MNIACIGWGSLLWKPGPLIFATPWQPGGPELPLEFTRNSEDSDELALVITESAPLMPTYWALMTTSYLDDAREQLRQRERIALDHPEWIGTALASNQVASDLRVTTWLARQAFDAVIWTALPPRFHQQDGRAPDEGEALALLSALQGEARRKAEEYIRNIPSEIMTPYRQRIIEALHWPPFADTR
ncbi:hypothetical protein [Duganella callida]|uniref:Uncharacterized protein n=1 Tax=Duganella callida TaxID=2561932 RepID=A0A4Y9S5G9_9BURK|nr:hypothetical protein [Duganella callida]TFW16591.1 hypothetical protein E4L98_22995 [Duganella callida]